MPPIEEFEILNFDQDGCRCLDFIVIYCLSDLKVVKLQTSALKTDHS